MNIDNFKPAIIYTIYIASTLEKVWQALTTAEFSRKYFSGFAVEAELKVGGALVVRAPDGSVHISGEVIACDPPKKLTITWNVNWPGLVEKLGVTLVTYEIEHAGDAVRLTLIQARPADRRRHPLRRRQGGHAILSSLKSLLETGEATLSDKNGARTQRMLAALKMGIATPWWLNSVVITQASRPRIHRSSRSRRKMDCQVKPGNDG